MSLTVPSFNSAVRLPVAPFVQTFGMLAITALAISAIDRLPKALGLNHQEKCRICFSACRGQYCDGPDLIHCFRRCREFYKC